MNLGKIKFDTIGRYYGEDVKRLKVIIKVPWSIVRDDKWGRKEIDLIDMAITELKSEIRKVKRKIPKDHLIDIEFRVKTVPINAKKKI